MCVLQTLIFHFFQCGVDWLYVYSRMYNRWKSRIYPEYVNYNGYEGASRYVIPFDVIHSSKKLKNEHKRYKYQTINDIAALKERNHITSGREYNMEDIKLDISLSGKAQCFDDYFHRK